MAVRPPRPAIDRRLGGHLPRQLANLTKAHSAPKVLYLLQDSYGISASLLELCRWAEEILTCYSPVRRWRPPSRGSVRLTCMC
ncbi:MAG: hypothetical protein ACTS6G_04945 [Candidatus Hodgkinia cicadicola]